MRTFPAFGALTLAALVALPACQKDEDSKSKPAAPPYGGGAPSSGVDARIDEALAKGRALLVAAQDASGAWGDPGNQIPPNVGYTAMAVTAVIGATTREKVDGDEAIKKALEWLRSKQQADGSIFDNPQVVNYMTSASIGAFHAAKQAAYRDAVAKARDYLVASQFADEKDVNFGAFPYHASSPRPADLSNVQFAAQALSDAGLPKDHVVWKRMETFLAKIQNSSERNTIRIEREVTVNGEKKTGTVVSGDDGGSAYAPGLSYAGWVAKADGTYTPLSYGSMTYALLRCLLMAGADAKDPRVVAALGWIARNFDVKKNPGMPAEREQQGYYYYLYTAARTLAEFERLTKEPLKITDAAGRPHDWRKELADELLARRDADGWWANAKESRWEEGSKVLASSYALTALGILRGRL